MTQNVWFITAYVFSCYISQLLSEEVDKVSTPRHRSACLLFFPCAINLTSCLHTNGSALPFCSHLPPQAEHELRVAQTEFDRQAEVTRLLLEGISSTHVSVLNI